MKIENNLADFQIYLKKWNLQTKTDGMGWEKLSKDITSWVILEK